MNGAAPTERGVDPGINGAAATDGPDANNGAWVADLFPGVHNGA